MSTYDEWKSTEPSDPWADEQERLDREAAEERAEHPERYEEPVIWTCDGCGVEGTEEAMDRHECEVSPDLDWSDLNDHADGINVVTGEVDQ